MRKKVLALFATLAACTFAFANGTAEKNPSASAKQRDLSSIVIDKDHPVELTIGVSSKNKGFPEKEEDDYVYQQILNDTGVKVKFQVIDDYYTALNVRIAGGDCPDLFQSNSAHMRIFAKNGDILDLTPYRDKELKNLMAWIGNTDTHPFMVGDELYALPKAYVNAMTYSLINVRKDWLDRLGLSIPKTVDDLYDVAYAFTYNDPDGNGKNDTIGFSGKAPYGFETIVNAYDTALGNYVIIRDGMVTNTLLQPHMKDALSMCKKFVDAGVIDPDIWTVNPRDKAIGGQLGMLTLEWSVMYKASYVKQIKSVNPNADWTYFGPLASEVGAQPALEPIDVTSSNNFLCVKSDISPEKLAAVFKLADYLVTDKGSMLVDFGKEGVHWEYGADGKPQMTKKAAEANYVATYQLFGREDKSYLNVKFKEAKDQILYAQQMPHIITYNSLVQEPEDFYLTDCNNYVSSQLIAFIYGQRPISEYDDFLKELETTYGFSKYMQACENQLRAAGYVK